MIKTTNKKIIIESVFPFSSSVFHHKRLEKNPIVGVVGSTLFDYVFSYKH